ncbi:hypothetical protein OKW43_000875 [Paraburkholderia sp. WC7.3g]
MLSGNQLSPRTGSQHQMNRGAFVAPHTSEEKVIISILTNPNVLRVFPLYSLAPNTDGAFARVLIRRPALPPNL